MGLGESLKAAVGKNIKQICENGYDDPALNHCAHFASHMCGMTFSYHCRNQAGGSKPPGNLRVHEVFAQCPKVGKWRDADLSRSQLIFVTRDSHVDLATKTMKNHPQKHIGVFHDGKVYHYGNTQDQVVTDTPGSFLRKFQAIYAGNQEIYYGWMPGEDLLLNVRENGTDASAEMKFELPEPVNGLWKAQLVGEPRDFVVGREVNQPRRRFHGIHNNIPENHSPIFKADDYLDDIDHWAVLLEITGHGESRNRFNLVNTYDRAKFTFGFYQLAAHTPRDNLILFFHKLARLPDFSGYFPELEIREGRLIRRGADGAFTDLEQEFLASNGEMQIMLFMNYLNPQRVPIDRQEVLQAARLIHWTAADPAARQAQVDMAAEILQRKMAKHALKLGLNGKSDTICAIVADIFHQGRATYNAVKPLLAGPSAEDALMRVGEQNYPGRCRDLREAVAAAKNANRLGKKVYVAATNEFVTR